MASVVWVPWKKVEKKQKPKLPYLYKQSNLPAHGTQETTFWKLPSTLSKTPLPSPFPKAKKMSFLRTGKELLYFEGVKIDATWRSENLDCVLRPHSKRSRYQHGCWFNLANLQHLHWWLVGHLQLSFESVLNDATWHCENLDCVLSPQAYLH